MVAASSEHVMSKFLDKGWAQSTYTHMDVPWWVGHDNVKFTQHRIVESAQITVDPLRGKLFIQTPVTYQNKLNVRD